MAKKLAKAGKESEMASAKGIKGKKKDAKEESKKGVKGKDNKFDSSDSTAAVQKPVTSRPSSGKTPISLLHEHAQKLKWEKVQYDMFKAKDGMVANAILAWMDPKSRETITVKVKHNLAPKETPIEARYFAACAALHRVCFNKNLHMVLPREFKDTWAVLEDERKVLLKSNKEQHDRMYNNDPFKVIISDRDAAKKRQKEQEAKQNNDAKVKKAQIVLTSVKKPTEASTKKADIVPVKRPAVPYTQAKSVKFPKKVWDSALSFNFTIKERDRIHKAIRSHIRWERCKTEPTVQRQLLISIGFRELHVDESLKYKDPLSFLLFNVPEDDLPDFFVDSRAVDSVTLADKNEVLIRKITEFGISRNEAILALNNNNTDVSETLVSLTERFAGFSREIEPIDDETSLEIWTEEIESLSVIYEPENFKKINDTTIQIQFNDYLTLTVYKPKSYPNQVAGLVISTVDKNYKLPTYIKLEIVSKAARYVSERLIGDCYIFSIVDWLQQNCDEIISSPGSILQDSANHDLEDSEINEGPSINERRYFKSRPDVDFIKADFESRKKSLEYSKMIDSRKTLPAWNEQTNLVATINSNSVSLITGETGSGKSTQVVQFILDDLYAKGDYKTQILCTQPRRISAIGLAERVAEERASYCGGEVGYLIRGVNKSNKNTKIKFLTTGILVKFLQNGDDFLNNTILVLDEVHERSMETDLIIIMIKKLLNKYKNMKIVLMSATVDVSLYQGYFKGLTTAHIKGRTFPIEDHYLDDVLQKTDFKIQINDEWINPKADSKYFQTGNINYDLIVSLVIKVDQDLVTKKNDGSILIFLPGVQEINKCVKLLNQNFNVPSIVLPLHSALSAQDQHRVFSSYPGKRKIIVSTNIAETSITINDCVVTIDSGKVKAMTYNPVDNTTKLVEIFESKAECKQRRGRAGRVTNGISYKLFTKETHDQMIDSPVPEMKRINLDSLYLVVKSMGIDDVIGFLNTGMDPPPLTSLLKSEEILKCSGLVDEYGDLTELGKLVSVLPTFDPKHGKLLIYAIIFGFTDFGLLLTSVLGVGSPFLKGHDLRDKVKAVMSRYKDYGDILAMTLIAQEYFSISENRKRHQFMNENHLSYTKITEIKSSMTQYASILEDLGFLPLKYEEGDSALNRNRNNFSIIRATMIGAFYPQVARIQLPDPKFLNTASGAVQADPDAKLIKYWIRNEEYITKLSQSENEEVSNENLPATRSFIHPSSVLFDTAMNEVDRTQLEQLEELKSEREDGLVEFEKLQRRKVDLTPQANKTRNSIIKSSFVIYNSSTVTSKLYLRDVTPVSTLSALLFGGPLSYDLNGISAGKHSPGIVLDSWLPIKTWCKNAVLVKELRVLLDKAIKAQLENPYYNGSSQIGSNSHRDILELIDNLLKDENR